MTDPSFKQKLQALVEASTKGPWFTHAGCSPWFDKTDIYTKAGIGDEKSILKVPCVARANGGMTRDRSHILSDLEAIYEKDKAGGFAVADAALIVALVNAAPAILELLEAAQSVRSLCEYEKGAPEGASVFINISRAREIVAALNALEASNG